MSEQGLIGSRGLDADLMAARAADARVTISTIRTGGVETSWRRTGRFMTFVGPPARTFYANADARELARQTGGVASAYSYASQTFDRLERATRFQYLLGYYPEGRDWNGERRIIEVRVNRPGLSVQHRGSYFARKDLVPFDRRAFLTHSRITGASAYRVLMKDVTVTVTGGMTSNKRDAWTAHAIVAIDPATVAFQKVDGRRVASIEIAVFAGGQRQQPVGEMRKRVEFNLSPESYARTRNEGLRFETAVHLKGEARCLKAIVYDYAADKLGSAVFEIK